MPADQGKLAIKGMLPEELQELVMAWGEPAYRGRQLAHWLYVQGARSFAEMRNLPRRLQVRLEEETCLKNGEIREVQKAEDGTRKYLLALADGEKVEFVLIPEKGRLTLCLSSQVGCAYGCAFCATGQGGLIRNLTAGEILEQALLVRRELGRRPTHIVFMGMGEPLANFAAVTRAVEILNHPEGLGIGMRHLTISTCGIVPRIYELAERRWQLNLAVSLHAADDETRSRLLPINQRYPLADLMAAARTYAEITGRRVTFAYVLLAGVNDRPRDVEALASWLGGWLCHLNLIPYNATDSAYRAPTPARVRQLAEALERRGIAVSIRSGRGAQIAAACGQLRRRNEEGSNGLVDLHRA